jgi:hypothetical protein
MNPVEIEEAVSDLVLEPFNRAEFAFQFLAAFGNKATAIDRMRAGATNPFDSHRSCRLKDNSAR